MGHIARLIFTDGHYEDRIYAKEERNEIRIPELRNGVVGEGTFVFDRALSDRDAIPTFVHFAWVSELMDA